MIAAVAPSMAEAEQYFFADSCTACATFRADEGEEVTILTKVAGSYHGGEPAAAE